MFDQLFQEPKILKHQLNAPLLEDRLRYLTYRAEQGTQRLMLREIAHYQVIAVKYLGLDHLHTPRSLHSTY